MPIVIVVLFFFGMNWIASYLLVILPIHLLDYLGDFWRLFLFIVISIILSFFLGD